MTYTNTFRCLTMALAVSLAGVVSAQTAPSWTQYSWEIPVLQGDYIAINGGTLGSVSLGFTGDANRTFGGATYFYGADGKYTTLATGGQVHFNNDPTVASTGVIAWTDISTYSIFDGPCRGCADHPRQQVQTSDVAHFDWTGPRAGRLTVNGQSQDMVEFNTGLPLVAPTDFSGMWLMVWRSDYGTTAQPAYHGERVAVVTLSPVSTIPPYTVVVQPGAVAFGVALPPPGAHLYDVRCASPGCDLSFTLPATPTPNQWTLWFNDAGVGRLMPVAVSGTGASTTYTVDDYGSELMRMYGTHERMVGRQAYPASTPCCGVRETAFFRLGPDTLNGQWTQPHP